MTTSRQLVGDLLGKKRVERVPVVDYPWDDTLAAWVQQGYPTRTVWRSVGEKRWSDDGRWVLIERAQDEGEYAEPVPPWQHFGYDLNKLNGLAYDYLPLVGQAELVDETDEWEIRRNGAGASLKRWKHKSGTPEHIAFSMISREIWERDYRAHLLHLDPRRVNLVELKRLYGESEKVPVWRHFGHFFVWETMRQSMGDVAMYESLVLDPGWIHDFCRVYTDFHKQHFAYVLEQVGMPDGVWFYEDLGYSSGLFASPRVLRELIFPYYKEIVDFFHERGLPVIFHSCGSVAEAIPLIIEAGFDALHPMERKADKNDPFAFAEKYGDKLAFVGGLDARVFESNDRDVIRREVSAYLEGMKARGARFVFSSDHSISPITRYDSYCYALDVYREHMLY